MHTDFAFHGSYIALLRAGVILVVLVGKSALLIDAVIGIQKASQLKNTQLFFVGACCTALDGRNLGLYRLALRVQ
jgi:hypothetical protein